jgi:hypothetical protein
MNKPFIAEEVTMETVKTIAKYSKIILYGANTCWWTASWNDIYRHPDVGLPCDPRGGVLMQTNGEDGWEEFIKQAEENPTHYGKHGLRAFLLAYHGCVKVQSAKTGNIVPTCLSTWQEYNDLIDENAKLDNLKGNIALACGELNKLLSAQANQRNGGE